MNPYQVIHDSTNAAFWTADYRYFSDTTSTYPDGFRRVRSSIFTIKNLDQTADMKFSFDGTHYSKLEAFDSFSQEISSDRYFYKTDTTSLPCTFQVIAALQSGWK